MTDVKVYNQKPKEHILQSLTTGPFSSESSSFSAVLTNGSNGLNTTDDEITWFVSSERES